MSDPILKVEDLRVYFYTYAGVVKAVDGVSFEVYNKEVFGLIGETGCGKTVTSRAITRLIPDPGRIESGRALFRINSRWVDLLKLPEDELRKIRGSMITYVFQDPTSALDPLYTAGYQIVETILAHNKTHPREAWSKAIETLRRVLIPEPEIRARSYPHELSGGMKQRVVAGASIVNEPRLLVADEPTTNVDVTIQAQMIELLSQLKNLKGMSIILVTHNMGLIAEMADRVAVMYAGKIVEIADVNTIFEEPLHPYTQGLINCVPDPTKELKELYPIAGTVPDLINPPSGCRFWPRCSRAMDICKREAPPGINVSEGHRVECWLYAGSGL
ncbi:MAG: ABC transporter ATP-binding protein [Candidatus Korarchaeota archaeon]|nr:ABC transporter ATP-binding protein [Thermoproteota archaeon]MCR8463111.1 ABC transporter ATP-binding protein [Thermoproteota archaeon]MCR8470989.1 ABC transporter ATP-binding protein [Thermoproteota archaeon]MCR8472268.1 ABC transporter ATP-binding protein [Thermoproteota archaeon]MCR8488782.1 ABC transporter ATP-binding protein [Thermoproteota archaeon]